MSDITTDPTRLSPDDLRAAVRDRYAAAARQADASLGDAQPASCCGPTGSATPEPKDAISRDLYDDHVADSLSGAFLASLGCGNPTLLADLMPGQTVLDLGSGGGLDVLLSARRVGPTGKAYGLDMTPEMLALARRNQQEAGVTNAEFLEGTIEHIPLPDDSVDVIISNCVINLAADKAPVLAEAFRVLKPGGRFAVSDIVLTRTLPEPALRAMTLWTGCIGGALIDTDYLAGLSAAGFSDARVEPTRFYARQDLLDLAEGIDPATIPADLDLESIVESMDGAITSASVRASKPALPS